MCSTGLNIAQSSLPENMMSMNNKSLFLKRIALQAKKDENAENMGILFKAVKIVIRDISFLFLCH